MRAEVIIAAFPGGSVQGRVLGLIEPISFWGGVSPENGRLIDPRSPLHGRSIASTVLMIRKLRGSSSASSVLLELIHRGHAPVALVLDRPDAILALGVLVAREMGWRCPPIVRLDADQQAAVADGVLVTITQDGQILTGAET